MSPTPPVKQSHFQADRKVCSFPYVLGFNSLVIKLEN